MNGHELAQRLLRLFADLKVVFVSGYASDSATRNLVLEPGNEFPAQAILDLCYPRAGSALSPRSQSDRCPGGMKPRWCSRAVLSWVCRKDTIKPVVSLPIFAAHSAQRIGL